MRLTEEQRADLLELFSQVAPDLGRFALTLRPVGCEAADLVQITFQEAARAWGTLSRRTPEDRRRWLYTVLRNKAIDERRKTGHVDPTPDDPRTGSAPDPAEIVAQAAALARCWAHIGRMSALRRRIAFLAWQKEWRTAEIATHLGIAPSTVRGHLHVVRQRLRADLGHLMSSTDTNDETTRDADERR